MSTNLAAPAPSINFIPLWGKVLISHLDKPEMKDGIFLPESARNGNKDYSEGIVVQTSENFKDDAGNLVHLSLLIGKKVLYARFSGQKIKINETSYDLVRHEEVLGIIE